MTPYIENSDATSDWLPGSMVASMVKRLQDIWGVDAEGSDMLQRTCDWIRSELFLTDIGLLKDGVIWCATLRNSLLKSLRIPHPAPDLLRRCFAAHNSLSLRKGLVVPSHFY